MKERGPTASAGRTALAVLAVMAFLTALHAPAGQAQAAGPSSELVVKTAAAKLSELEVMVRFKWWGRVEKDYAGLEAIVQANKLDNAVILERMRAVKAALDAELATRAGDLEAGRLDELVKRVKAHDRFFPVDKYRVISVRPDGSGDAKTLGEALALSDDKDVIELHTGTYPLAVADLEGKGKDGRGGRASVFIAARGQWPRIVPAGAADYTFDHRRWVDGLEIIAGAKGVAKFTLDARNCYLRALKPPPAPTEGAGGLIQSDPTAAHCVFQNFTTALAPGRNATVRNNLFVTCVTAVRRDRDDTTVTSCVFYRCLTALWGDKMAAERSVFSRCKAEINDRGKLTKTNCLEAEEPFRNPFKGDFRLRSGVTVGPAGSQVGPAWSDERWEMFITNYNRAVQDPPLGLAEVRDLSAAWAMNEVRSAFEIKDYKVAAEKLADVFGRYAACPSVRRISGEVDRLADTVLTELLKADAASQPDEDKDRQVAARYVEQARAAVAAGKKDDAQAAARRAVELDSRHVEAHILLAELLVEAGRAGQAAPLAKRSGDLLEASADRVSPELKARQIQLQGKLTRIVKLGQDWQKLMADQSARYAGLAGQPGPLSTAMAWRRAKLLDPDNETYKKRSVIAESVLQPLAPPAEKPDPEEAKKLRVEADKMFALRQYNKCVDLRSQAWALDPTVEDLIFLGHCYQNLQLSPRAATLALQAKQQAMGMVETDRGRRALSQAIDLLRQADPMMPRLEQMDRDFANQADIKRKVLENAGDRDTAEAISQLLDQLARIDAIDTKPPRGEQQ